MLFLQTLLSCKSLLFLQFLPPCTLFLGLLGLRQSCSCLAIFFSLLLRFFFKLLFLCCSHLLRVFRRLNFAKSCLLLRILFTLLFFLFLLLFMFHFRLYPGGDVAVFIWEKIKIFHNVYHVFLQFFNFLHVSNYFVAQVLHLNVTHCVL